MFENLVIADNGIIKLIVNSIILKHKLNLYCKAYPSKLNKVEQSEKGKQIYLINKKTALFIF